MVERLKRFREVVQANALAGRNDLARLEFAAPLSASGNARQFPALRLGARFAAHVAYCELLGGEEGGGGSGVTGALGAAGNGRSRRRGWRGWPDRRLLDRH